MAEAVYLSCALASAFCAWLLLRHYRSQRSGLLMWSAACFVGLAINGAIVVVDLMVVPQVDLAVVRATIALVAMLLLVVGLIWESR